MVNMVTKPAMKNSSCIAGAGLHFQQVILGKVETLEQS
jgi:hypothetical protein